MGRSNYSSTHSFNGRGRLGAIVSVGIDLAKKVFAVHGVDESGKPALVRPSVPRARLIEFIASLPPCLSNEWSPWRASFIRVRCQQMQHQ